MPTSIDVIDGLSVHQTVATNDALVPQLGAITETAPATDTASSGLNGRLQRVAQRITSLIALLPTSLGQKTKANSLAVTLASDQDTLAVSNASLPLPTGAATAAKQPALGTAGASSTDVLSVQGIASGTALPVSAASLPLPSGAATSAQIGEVQASPTSNTVLDRLKALLTGIVLSAGSALIGKVGIDQTTPGTTNAVAPINGQTGVAGGSGVTGATVQRVVLATDVGLPAGESFLGQIGGPVTNPSTNFTRPADTTAYAIGDLVANSTTAGSVVAMTFTVARATAGSVMLRRMIASKSGTGVTNALFRLHLFRAAPSTITNGDNGAFSVSGVADYIGAFDVIIDRAFTDGAAGTGVPVNASEMTIKLASGTTIFGLVEARAAYTPVSAEVFTFVFDNLQN